ncbi:TetR/AcrR family transcriptional regulator [Acuticoccus mangrovi]|uniref:TetR family transcriptional regulator n=1 Tax=Acuticoccus mangrovi TaxID=2796142 RepID=A0A934INW8_9HYPH|nr:TetR family transcriptional regulator [Acuticoccus mangrovi]MBJ3777332.1 TetR family transcriptional regulator [Acuticoccus mangrovi]
MGATDTREHIVEAADRLFYENGYAATSFADIAAAVGLSRGNFYYHFKTKDELLGAVIARRLASTEAMLAAWEEGASSPVARIRRFIDILVMNRAKIIAYGCPVGTLCEELAKLDHAAQDDAAAIFGAYRGWLAGEFAALGRAADADSLALHVLMRSQGIATLATAFHDEAIIHREVAALTAWLAAEVGEASRPTPTAPQRPS